MEIIVGIPAYNEEKNIASTIVKLKNTTHKIIVCDDGSSDATADIARELGAIVINHPKNLGYGSAIRSIFLKSKEIQADILVTFDADGQHQADDIKKIIKPIINNEADIVIGSRFLEKQSDMPQYRKVGIKIITRVTNSTLSKKLSDSQSGFRAYSKDVLSKLTPSDSGMGVSTEILIKANTIGYRIAEVPIKIFYGKDTSTHNPFSHGASVLLTTIKFTSIEHPLQFYGVPALVFLVIGLSFILWTIQTYASSREVITNIALVGIGSTIIGIVLLIAAILLYSLVSIVSEHNRK